MAEASNASTDSAQNQGSGIKLTPVNITGRVTPTTLAAASNARPAALPPNTSAVMRDPELTEAHKQLRDYVVRAMKRIDLMLAEAAEARGAQAAQLGEHAGAVAQARTALDTLRTRLDAVASQQQAFAETRLGSVDAALAELRDVTMRAEAVGRELQQRVDEAASQHNQRLDDVTSQHNQRLDSIEQTAAGWHEVARIVEQLPDGVAALLGARLDAVTQQVAERTESLHEHLKHAAGAAEQRANESTAGLRDQLQQAQEQLTARHDAMDHRVHERFDAADSRLGQMAEAVDNVAARADKLDNATSRMAELHQVVTALPAQLQSALSASDAATAQRLQAVERTAEAVVTQMRQLHGETTDRASRTDADVRASLAGIKRIAAITLVVALAAAVATVAVLLKVLGAW